jgi:hypothetical protein
MSITTYEDLHSTVIATWYARLAGNPSPRRNHWHTKTLYYQAVAELLSARPGQPLTWKSIVGAARPHGRRSTFYEVAGGRARHRMVGDLIEDGRNDSIQIALGYLRTDPVEQLIDETKVWSYWPFRHYLLNRVISPDMTVAATADALIRTVVVWGRRNKGLAAAIGHSPPACAVEDLTLIHDGQLAASRAASRLTDALRHAVP